ncbi:hypothetical protein ACQP2U_42785 (plasmid) [Nocardia sp. CA-084685]|uniref:hypothetical protein n=1 Tax=Nocardia sp. CA-084685 TaxID=3239970 RepID=UPI003D961BC5
MTSTDRVSAKWWPNAGELIAAVRGALLGAGGQSTHPVLSLVCDLTLMYRDHGEIIQRCAAPPALLGLEQARDIHTAAAAADFRFAKRFDQLAAHAFDLGQSRPGLLAARIVYWVVNAEPATVHHFLAATLAYDQWLDRVSTPALAGQPVEAAYT